ncbi:XRE family transcriptional regulator [Streptomyces dangxiongensis]|uniref:XRE family transcriptional regulator n=1 Tax=Streptomyces dangxiongensis TaxID=1442032 RepID=A0A3G2JH24_9ACTN|nr:helix-turn-helix transcriptional regulator [Streptomyces dangxiongensis]AYN41706.1 XRE family transcriptional regulator [Streptomyces dangxiongensis]
MNRRKLDPQASAKAAFGQLLRRLRDKEGLTQQELADRIGCTDSHISAVETGRRSPTPQFAASADRALGTGYQLQRECEEVHRPSLLEGFREYVPHELRAVEIRLFEVGIIPGLLQTPEYAAAIQAGAVRRGAITESQAEERLSHLAERQAALARTPVPLVHAVLDESCIRRPVGGPEVMAGQLDRLIEFAELPSTVLQVAPYALGERRAFDLPVTMLTLRDRTQLVYAESAQRGHLVREATSVVTALTAYHQLQVEAESQTASVAMIRELRKGIL